MPQNGMEVTPGLNGIGRMVKKHGPRDLKKKAFANIAEVIIFRFFQECFVL